MWRQNFWMANFGGKTPKPSSLWSNDTRIKLFRGKLSKLKQKQLKENNKVQANPSRTMLA